MKIHYDQKADALYLRFADAEVEESQEVLPNVVVDYDSEDRIVAIEILDASTRVAGGAELKTMKVA